MANSGSIFDKIENKQAYKVPDRYFDNLPGKLMDSTSTDEQLSQTKKQKLIKFKHIFAYAASFIGIIFISYLGINHLTSNRNNQYISENDAIEYLTLYSSDFDESSIIENIQEMDNKSQSEKEDESETIIHYLIEEGIDEIHLYNEL